MGFFVSRTSRAILDRGENAMKTILTALALATTSLAGAAAPICGTAYASEACCKVCKKGKACGDSCIAADKKCTKGKGCACNG